MFYCLQYVTIRGGRMQEINVKEAHAFTKNLNVLYAEDDLSLQAQTEKIFKLLFNSVVSVNDGQEALAMYNRQNFDLVITDILMPNMDGLELSKKIKEIDPNQTIIVISAHNDSQQLLDFINLNINQYLRKPIVMDNTLYTLYITAKHIINDRMIEKYRVDIEEKNQKLKVKSDEFNNLINILDTKLYQLSTVNPDIDLSKSNIQEKHLSELNELGKDIDGISTLLELSESSINPKIETLGELFIDYSKIISQYAEYNELSSNIKEFGEKISSEPEKFTKHIDKNSILLKSILYVLKLWRDNLKDNNVKKAFALHASIINDIKSIEL